MRSDVVPLLDSDYSGGSDDDVSGVRRLRLLSVLLFLWRLRPSFPRHVGTRNNTTALVVRCREVFIDMNAGRETALREYCSGCCSGFAVQDHKVVGVVFHSHVGNVDGEPLR